MDVKNYLGATVFKQCAFHASMYNKTNRKYLGRPPPTGTLQYVKGTLQRDGERAV